MQTNISFCLVCLHTHHRKYSFDYSDISAFTPTRRLALVECTNCGFVRNSNFNVDGCADFYSTNASGYIGADQFSLRSNDLIVKHNAQLEFIRSVYSSGKWLDLGCCDGALQQHARTQNYFDAQFTEFNSIDLKTRHLFELGSLMDIKFYESDIESGEFPNELTDISLFTLMHVLEHLNDPYTVLRSLHKISSPHSTLIIETPDRNGYNFNRSPELWYSLIEHVNHFNFLNLFQLATRAGWSFKRAERYIGRSPGIDYPAVIIAFSRNSNYNSMLSYNTLELEQVEKNISELAAVLNKIKSIEKVCLWGYSKLFKLLIPRLKNNFIIFDSNNAMHDEVNNCDNYSRFNIIKTPPTPDYFDKIIITATASFDTIRSNAFKLGWNSNNIINILDLKVDGNQINDF
jgi:2-polyprenyl-3-methyl-5-hydroxy-6-metoxy-1,4-benzoquinol methylase